MLCTLRDARSACHVNRIDTCSQRWSCVDTPTFLSGSYTQHTGLHTRLVLVRSKGLSPPKTHFSTQMGFCTFDYYPPFFLFSFRPLLSALFLTKLCCFMNFVGSVTVTCYFFHSFTFFFSSFTFVRPWLLFVIYRFFFSFGHRSERPASRYIYMYVRKGIVCSSCERKIKTCIHVIVVHSPFFCFFVFTFEVSSFCCHECSLGFIGLHWNRLIFRVAKNNQMTWCNAAQKKTPFLLFFAQFLAPLPLPLCIVHPHCSTRNRLFSFLALGTFILGARFLLVSKGQRRALTEMDRKAKKRIAFLWEGGEAI